MSVRLALHRIVILRSVALTAAIIGIGLVSGCGGNSDFIATPESLVGKVDTTLPVEAQKKQQAVLRFLAAMQEGVGDAEQLQLVAPGIRFKEFGSFLEGTGRLARWEFEGAPNGNNVGVKLYFDSQASGPIDPSRLQLKQRTYVVSGSGNSIQISTAKS
jgi:hypothetical protein